MKTLRALSMLAALAGLAGVSRAAENSSSVVVTASNGASANQLLVYDTSGKLLQTVPTKGLGGVSGNAGGIAERGGLLAVVNFGSQTVSLFSLREGSVRLLQVIPSVSSPVSVAFGGNHLYILGTTRIESHAVFGSTVSASADGVVGLLKADGSAAQVGVLPGELIVTEKAGVIETVTLSASGAVSGAATLVKNIPANPLAPFGLITRDNNAYVTIAHSNEISLVRGGTVLTTTGSGTQNAPCWLALVGPFLYSTNSPSQTVSRYAVYGQKIVQDLAVAATFTGNPTDIAYGNGVVAVIDGANGASRVSLFNVDEDGGLTLKSATTTAAAANGVVVVSSHREE